MPFGLCGCCRQGDLGVGQGLFRKPFFASSFVLYTTVSLVGSSVVSGHNPESSKFSSDSSWCDCPAFGAFLLLSEGAPGRCRSLAQCPVHQALPQTCGRHLRDHAGSNSLRLRSHAGSPNSVPRRCEAFTLRVCQLVSPNCGGSYAAKSLIDIEECLLFRRMPFARALGPSSRKLFRLFRSRVF